MSELLFWAAWYLICGLLSCAIIHYSDESVGIWPDIDAILNITMMWPAALALVATAHLYHEFKRTKA